MTAGSFDSEVDAPHRGKSAAEIEALPVDALKGVSDPDHQQLESAFGIKTVGDLARNRFYEVAKSIAEEAADIGHDPGPNIDWTTFFAAAPLAKYLENPSDFRLDFGPIYYRGRLDGTARLMIVGQDPAPNELIGHRAFVGFSGQRLQGFLRKIGIGRDYVMVNTFLYPVFGQFDDGLKALTQSDEILGYRNEYFDRVADQNPIEAVITVGSAARDAIERWPRAGDFFVQHIVHPAAPESAVLPSWNAALAALRPKVAPEVGFAMDNTDYGSAFTEDDDTPIPRRDLPFGVPDFHGVGSRATRGRLENGNTNHKEIIWTAP